MKKIYSFFLSTIVTTSVFSQINPLIGWSRTYEGGSNVIAKAFTNSHDGGYVLVGESGNSGGILTNHLGSKDFWLVKTDVYGIHQWQKTYGGPSSDMPNSVIKTADGGYMIIGSTTSYSGNITNAKGIVDGWVVKTDNMGNILWQKTYGGNDIDYTYNAIETNDNGYVITGRTSSTNGDVITSVRPTNSAWIFKIDNTGNILWQNIFAGIGMQYLKSIQKTSDDGFILTGLTSITDGPVSTFGAEDLWTVKLDSLGQMEWERRFGTAHNDVGNSVIQTLDGGYLVVGTYENSLYSTSGGATALGGQAVIIKLDSAGNTQWEKMYGGSGNDFGLSGIQLSNGNYGIVGTSTSNNLDIPLNKGQKDYWLFELDSNGDIVSNHIFGGSADDEAVSLVQLENNEMTLFGNTKSANMDITSGSTLNKMWLFNLSNKLSTNDASKNKKITIFPNPTSEILQIINLQKNSEITIFDMAGRLIFKNKYQDESINIDVSNFTKGTYAVQIKNKDNISTNKIIIK